MLELRKLDASHVSDRWVGWLNDPKVVTFSEHRKTKHTIKSCKEFVSQFDQKTQFIWGIFVDGEHIGNITARADGDIGILIGETSKHNRGYGTEAFKQVCLFMKFRGIEPNAGTTNPAMKRVLDKLGLKNRLE